MGGVPVEVLMGGVPVEVLMGGVPGGGVNG